MSEIIESVHEERRTQAVRSLILSIAKSLVDDPRSVAVDATHDEKGTTMVLRVAAADVAKVTGEDDRTVDSIRAVLRAASTKLGRNFFLNIQEISQPARELTQTYPGGLGHGPLP